MNNDIAIKVENLTKIYRLYDKPLDRLKETFHPFKKKYHREFYALNDVSFEVKRGETVGIIGKNGAGKSTLLQIITGVLSPTAGNITVNGKISALLELGTGFNPELTGIENIYFSGTVMGYSKKEIDEKIDDIISFADIGDFIYQPVKIYSSGMFARLAFSVAININPDILIVDEILSVGDKLFRLKCLNTFYKVVESGCTILFVSHDEYTVKSFCQNAVYLKDGQMAGHGPSGSIIDMYICDLEASVKNNKSLQEKQIAEICQSIDENTSPVYSLTDKDSVDAGISEEEKNVAETLQVKESTLFRIYNVELCDKDGNSIETVKTNQEVILKFSYRKTGQWSNKISFVFNLYRHDDFYICGTTTIMDGYAPFNPAEEGNISIRFPSLGLLTGRYKFRVAINDEGGIGIIAESNPAFKFKVEDDFQAVGLFNLNREWSVDL